MVDLKANGWVMQGTVPQVGGVGSVPPGAGPFSSSNYYSLGTGADILDFASGPFTAVGIGMPTSDSGTALSPFLSDDDNVSNGWRLVLRETAHLGRFSGITDNSSANTYSLNSIVVLCGGISGANSLVKMNSGATHTLANTYTQDTLSVAKIGFQLAVNVFLGIIYEIYVTTTTPSDALFTSIIGQAFARMRKSVP